MYIFLRAGQNRLLDMLRLLAKAILIRATILLPTPQHIRGPGLDNTLRRAPRQLYDGPLSSPTKREGWRLTVLVICLCNPSSPSSCTAWPLPILLKLSRIKSS